MDSEKLGEKINNLEAWIQMKEQYLRSTKSELSTSAELINDALKNLGSNSN